MERVPSLDRLLEDLAAGRAADPLAPVTVICPSHVAALGLRRRLAELGPYAGVRFETLPRLAELIGAGALAARGLRPLARPIGDHLAERVAAGSRPPLAPLAGLPGYARALRRLFARLRRGGLRGGEAPPDGCDSPHLAEVMRLFVGFREASAAFYDEEDLLDAAAHAVEADPRRADELGALHLVPPGPRSAGGQALLAALGRARGGVGEVAEAPGPGAARIVLAPDLAAEAREVAREVLAALEDGVALDRVAVLHGADPAYARPLREALAAAGVPVAAMPGLPLVETPAGRGVLLLLELALQDLSRTALIDLLTAAPVRPRLPAGDDLVPARPGRWDRISRAAGITHGLSRWREGIAALRADREAAAERAADEGREAGWLRDEAEEALRLLAVVERLHARLRDLEPDRAAAAFIARLQEIVADVLEPSAPGMEEVQAEIARLGTVDAVGGTFSLESFARALRVNLEAAAIREGRLGEGVLVADHRLAAGLRFQRVVLCGAAEGLLPAGPGTDTLVPDRAWAALRLVHPLIEDAALRLERGQEAAARAVAAGEETVMTCPLYEAAGVRERYPAPLAVAAAGRHDPSITTGTALRTSPAAAWLRRPPSPLAAQLRGPAVDAWEAGLRGAVALVQAGAGVPPGDPLARPLSMLRARRGSELTEWDGGLAGLVGDPWLSLPAPSSPTRLEDYGTCGFRFLLRTLLRVRAPEDPRDQETMEPVVRGSIVHGTLEAFFSDPRARERIAAGEAWTDDDEARLLAFLDERLEEARRRGLAGLAVFARSEERLLRADLRTFLVEDSAFRQLTGTRAVDLERIVEGVVAGVGLRGLADRVDRTADGAPALVIDYKTGSSRDFEAIAKGDPLGGGSKLQLPVYLAGTGAAAALYWFISSRGGFERVEYEDSPENRQRFEATLAAIAEGVAAGAFPAVPAQFNEFRNDFTNCTWCDFTRLCSRSRDVQLDRKAESRGVLTWRRVAEAGAP